ncbi:toxin-antitoxin system protein [Pseudoroseomonas cervicalis]|uniref:toxin-antitoxin system protein n=1 Tax=Teichococcus cervicalis TaxID=204525 RepID=UPI0022F17C70|nr:toxin-antitoxin system protein [Pseudoroseomonas cervicalis]WBV42197.1 toxin-antitoxin system protein [Pseudoroseomonas cervicalis]
MPTEDWTPLLRALEPYPALRDRMAEPGLTLEQRVTLLRQAGFEVSAEALHAGGLAHPPGGEAGGALPETALDQVAGGYSLTFTNTGGGGGSPLVFLKPTQPSMPGMPIAWQVLTRDP